MKILFLFPLVFFALNATANSQELGLHSRVYDRRVENSGRIEELLPNGMALVKYDIFYRSAIDFRSHNSDQTAVADLRDLGPRVDCNLQGNLCAKSEVENTLTNNKPEQGVILEIFLTNRDYSGQNRYPRNMYKIKFADKDFTVIYPGYFLRKKEAAPEDAKN